MSLCTCDHLPLLGTPLNKRKTKTNRCCDRTIIVVLVVGLGIVLSRVVGRVIDTVFVFVRMARLEFGLVVLFVVLSLASSLV